MPQLLEEFVDTIVAFANGKQTCNERNDFRELAIFKAASPFKYSLSFTPQLRRETLLSNKGRRFKSGVSEYDAPFCLIP